MARLTKAKRDALPASAFAIPSERKFPINDAGHRQAAMGRLGTPAAKGHVEEIKKKVRARSGYGGNPVDGGK